MNDCGADEHVKEVYARFGLTVYLVQVLEHGLANALVSTELLPRRSYKSVPRNNGRVNLMRSWICSSKRHWVGLSKA